MKCDECGIANAHERFAEHVNAVVYRHHRRISELLIFRINGGILKSYLHAAVEMVGCTSQDPSFGSSRDK